MKLFLIAGARPNFMKISPIVRALKKRQSSGDGRTIEWKLVHTGQHYDFEMSQAFFEDLELPEPDYFLSGGSGSHAAQTAKIMVGFEQICLENRPDVVMVVGDVNSTLACSIVAKKLKIKVAHVEAGLRSFDLGMPEEINRLVTDSISDYYFVTEQSAIDNLRQEGKRTGDIFFVGHVMIDNLLYQLDRLEKDRPMQRSFQTYELKQRLGRYVFMTLHRPSNVDDKGVLEEISKAIEMIATDIPVIFPVHPRTRKNLEKFNIRLNGNVHLLTPLSFKEALFLWRDSKMVLTDSGGLQEETTGIGIPCLTLRDNTERPVTVDKGTNRIVGNKKEKILKTFRDTIEISPVQAARPPKWDGRAAERIVAVIAGLCEGC